MLADLTQPSRRPWPLIWPSTYKLSIALYLKILKMRNLYHCVEIGIRKFHFHSVIETMCRLASSVHLGSSIPTMTFWDHNLFFLLLRIKINLYHSLNRFSRQQNCWYFSQKIGSDISCKLSSKETVCMKYQNIFSRKSKKNISNCHLLIFSPSMPSIKLSHQKVGTWHLRNRKIWFTNKKIKTNFPMKHAQ